MAFVPCFDKGWRLFFVVDFWFDWYINRTQTLAMCRGKLNLHLLQNNNPFQRDNVGANPICLVFWIRVGVYFCGRFLVWLVYLPAKPICKKCLTIIDDFCQLHDLIKSIIICPIQQMESVYGHTARMVRCFDGIAIKDKQIWCTP